MSVDQTGLADGQSSTQMPAMPACIDVEDFSPVASLPDLRGGGENS